MIDEEVKEKIDGANGVIIFLSFEFELEFKLELIWIAEIETISWFLGGRFPMSNVNAKGISFLSLKEEENSWFKFIFKLLQHFVVTITFDSIITFVFIVTEVGDKVVQ